MPIALRTPLNQNVDRITVLINGTPQIVLLAANLDKYFIEMPGIAQSTLAFLQNSGVLRSKSVAPLTNRFIRNLDPALGQEIFDNPKTETESVVEPNCVADDFRWESMSVVS